MPHLTEQDANRLNTKKASEEIFKSLFPSGRTRKSKIY